MTIFLLAWVVCFGSTLDNFLSFKQKKNFHPPVYPHLKICNYKKEPYEYKDTHFHCMPILKNV